MTIIELMLLTIAASSTVAGTGKPGLVGDSAETRARVEFEITQFHAEWQRSWKLSERQRSFFADSSYFFRRPYFHCHNDMAANQVAAMKARRAGVRNLIRVGPPNRGELHVRPDTTFSVISAKESAFSVCPTWLLREFEQGSDESTWRDGAIMPVLRPHVSNLRERLLEILDAAATQYPGDGYIAGQRVRFHVDQKNWGKAADAARACRAERWWCLAIEGFAIGRQGAIHGADTVFARMRAALDNEARCKWIDARTLLAEHEQKAYALLDCKSREEITTRLWWLADPFYRIVGNERLVEHELRQVELLLRKATAHDERYAWYEERGGDAIIELITRYGWPSHAGWAGPDDDIGHSGWLDLYHSPPAAPYTTFEYTVGRIHTLPMWDAVLSPFESVVTDWAFTAENAAGEPIADWWPREHFMSRRRMIRLEEGQTAFFRRQNHVNIATALRLTHPAISTEQRFDVLMLTSPGPGRVDSIAQATVRGLQKVVLQGRVDTLPSVLSVEGLGTRLDARARLGIVPPATLASLPRDAIALSDPVLLEPGDDNASVLSDEALLESMLPTADVEGTQRSLRVFWETYGVNPDDTVTVSVRVTRDVTVGRLRRIGILLNLASDPNNSVEVRWTEPNPQRATRTLAGPVTVQMRLLSLNVAQLAPGPYILEVGMQRPNGPVVRSQRRFSIRQ